MKTTRERALHRQLGEWDALACQT